MSAVFPPDVPGALRELTQRVRALERQATVIESTDNSVFVDQVDARTWDLAVNQSDIFDPHSDWEQIQSPVTVVPWNPGSNVVQLDFSRVAGSSFMNLNGFTGPDQDPRVFKNGVYNFSILIQTITVPNAGAKMEFRIDVSSVFASKGIIQDKIGDGVHAMEITLEATAVLDRSLIPLSESIRVQVRNLDTIDHTIGAATMSCLLLVRRQ